MEKYWVKAHIFRALNFKEQGSRRRCVRVFREALYRYPQSEELRISCYMNLAGLTYHTAPQTARRFLSRALGLVESRNGSGGSRWLWLYNDRILCGLFSGGGDLEEIRAARERADHQYSLSNLVRTFAFEACVHYDRGDLGLAETFFSKAIQVGTVQGGTKPGFLFLTDVIAVKLLAGKDVARDLEGAQQWLMEHFDTVMEKSTAIRCEGRITCSRQWCRGSFLSERRGGPTWSVLSNTGGRGTPVCRTPCSGPKMSTGIFCAGHDHCAFLR